MELCQFPSGPSLTPCQGNNLHNHSSGDVVNDIHIAMTQNSQQKSYTWWYTSAFNKPIRCSRDRAHALVSAAGPPYSDSILLLTFMSIPLAAAETMAVVTDPPLLRRVCT